MTNQATQFDLGAPDQQALDDFAAWIDEMNARDRDFDDFVNDDQLMNERAA